jgi:hypothetical protein
MPLMQLITGDVMVRFHLLKTRALAEELAASPKSEYTGFQYMLAQTLLWYCMNYYNLWLGSSVTWMFFVEWATVLLIVFLGLYRAYHANGAENGKDFLVRATCLAFPISVKVTLVSILLGWTAFYFVDPIIITSTAFRNPSNVLDLVYFVWAPAFTAILFWRLNIAFRRLRKAEIWHTNAG